MCIKINLKQTVLARLFFFVIYDGEIPFMHLSWTVEGLMLLTLRVTFHSSLRGFLWEIRTRSITFCWRHVTSVSSHGEVRRL